MRLEQALGRPVPADGHAGGGLGEWQVDPTTRRVVDGREPYLTHLVWQESRDCADPRLVARLAWQRFVATADLSRPHGSKPWREQDAIAKARAACRKRRRMAEAEAAAAPEAPPRWLPEFYDRPTRPRAAELARQRALIVAHLDLGYRFVLAHREAAAEGRAAAQAEPDPSRKHRVARVARKAVAARHGFGARLPRDPPRMLITGSQGSGKTRDELHALARDPRPVRHLYVGFRCVGGLQASSGPLPSDQTARPKA